MNIKTITTTTTTTTTTTHVSTTRKIAAEEAHLGRFHIARKLGLGAIPNANDILAVKPSTFGQSSNKDTKDFIWTHMRPVEINVQQERDKSWRAVRMCACVRVRACGSAHLTHTHTHTRTYTHTHSANRRTTRT